ncbi:MAG TPA: hypothetical protein DD412_06325, partial [Holosporales bacterium]|nr:hypothetical protein [Holosporales bacterium]
RVYQFRHRGTIESSPKESFAELPIVQYYSEKSHRINENYRFFEKSLYSIYTLLFVKEKD